MIVYRCTKMYLISCSIKESSLRGLGEYGHLHTLLKFLMKEFCVNTNKKKIQTLHLMGFFS